MDVNKLLNDVKNLNHYIAATQDIVNMCNSSKIQFNMTTVLSMKKMRSLEIEYFNKCNKSGAAFIIFEYMLRLPPSKTWNLLGKELILLIQYWLEALRRYLISHNPTWWTFLKSLLKFIKDIKQKDQTLPDVLVQETAECLLDLATNSTLNAFQKHEVTSILNICCAESSREIRFSLREKLAGYFLRLSNIMATCGHLPLQFSMMETLLRWLLYRQNRNIRNEVVTEWFPGHIYHEKVINLFLERPWRNVFQDARDLLNAHNEVSGLVTSMQCSRLEVGETVVVTGNEKWTHWLDINSSSKSLTILLEPWLLEGLGGENITTCEVFTITEENTRNVKLHRESEEIVLTVNTIEPPQLLPSACKLLERYGCDMKITISPGGDIARIDKLLRYVFAEKYQILINIEDMPLAREVPSEHNKRNSVSVSS